MIELSKEELIQFTEYCNRLLKHPNLHAEIFSEFKLSDSSSFDLLFLFQRVKNSAEDGQKIMMKTIKDIRSELRGGKPYGGIALEGFPDPHRMEAIFGQMRAPNPITPPAYQAAYPEADPDAIDENLL